MNQLETRASRTDIDYYDIEAYDTVLKPTAELSLLASLADDLSPKLTRISSCGAHQPLFEERLASSGPKNRRKINLDYLVSVQHNPFCASARPGQLDREWRTLVY